MAKKEETVEKKKITKKISHSSQSDQNKKNIEKILIENFADFQRVMLKLSNNFENLSKRISDLLDLFEDSAQILVKNEIESNKDKNYNKEILEKMDKILNQNKIIAKGLTLIHEKNLVTEEITPRKMMPTNLQNKGYTSSIMPPENSDANPKRPQEIKFDVPGQEEDDEGPVFQIPG